MWKWKYESKLYNMYKSKLYNMYEMYESVNVLVWNFKAWMRESVTVIKVWVRESDSQTCGCEDALHVWHSA